MKKTCCFCKREQHVTAFNRNRAKPDGRNSQCRSCDNTRLRKWKNDNVRYAGFFQAHGSYIDDGGLGGIQSTMKAVIGKKARQ